MTFRNGDTHVDTIVSNTSGSFQETHPYRLSKREYSYRKDGSYHAQVGEVFPYDIVKIELVDQPKYHHLEKQVKEMQRQIEVTQAEIQRLKNEEENTLAEYSGYRVVKENQGAVSGSVVFYRPNGDRCDRLPYHVMMQLAKQMSS